MKRTIQATAAVFALLAFNAAYAQQNAAEAVAKVDEAYRVAKLQRDVTTLRRILADGFNETNQNGNSRNKAETIDLWKTFTIDSLTTDSAQVTVAGDTAKVMGTQTEGGERMLFTRVYVKGDTGWQLLASTQFRNPNADVKPLPSGVAGDVMKADEAFRLAKVNHDTQSLERLLADGFHEINQHSSIRNKAEMLVLFRDFQIDSLTTNSFEVRLAGDTAMVTGTQTEGSMPRMLFTRVRVKAAGGWQLFASMQFNDPRAPGL